MQLIEYLPQFMREIKEMSEIMESEQPEIELILENTQKVLNNGFIDTLDSYGCSRWESMLGITAKGTDSLENRRFRIKAALLGETPYTMRSLENKLSVLCGEYFTIEYSNDIYTLKIRIGLKAKQQYEYILKMLNEIVPANIIIDCRLLYNKHSDLEKVRHVDLQPFTHGEICEEVFE